ncbi:MAG TPA: hypothetical protein VM451_11205 [Candidatus Limnocylindria bacterium]|nr:hypothetical protein [Candidatus Limnocylindria bacterium]
MSAMGTVDAAEDRRDDVRIARVHLRMGQLTLARAELEDLLGRDALDTSGLASLAEARWRTGDAPAAADLAMAHLEAGGSDDVATCIAAEALAASGRADDARELMLRLPASDASTLDLLFAGMPRRASWPAGSVGRNDLEELRRDTDTKVFGRSMLSRAADADADAAAAPTAATSGAAAPADSEDGPARAVPGPREVIEATTAGAIVAASRFAAGGPAAAGMAGSAGLSGRERRPAARRAKAQMDPIAELARAREELDAKPEQALLRLGLVLRHDPTLAPAVLNALHLRRDPAAALLRGDAQRLLGRHLEAEAAFDVAAESLEVP